jgi:hypothetical protein
MSAKFEELLTISNNYICQRIRKNFYINSGYSKKHETIDLFILVLGVHRVPIHI